MKRRTYWIGERQVSAWTFWIVLLAVLVVGCAFFVLLGVLLP